MTAITLNSDIIYQGQSQNHDTIYNDFVDHINDDKIFDCKNAWLCEIETSKSNDERIHWNNLLDEVVKNHLIPFVENHWNPLIPIDVYLQGVWLNRYKKYTYQEEHVHVGPNHHFSFNYILQSTPESSDFLIRNKTYEMATALGLTQFLQPQKEFWQADKEPGTILIFPSYLPHLVTTNLSDEVRATVSGNFQIAAKNGVFIG